MKPPEKKADGGLRAPPDPATVSNSSLQPDDDEAPGVPGFRTWKGIYTFVFVVFVIVVAALALFARVFA